MELKKCSKCEQDLPNTNEYFSWRDKKKWTLRSECKECQRKLKKEYRENNKDKIKECSKKYYQANKDKIKNRIKEYEEENKDKIKEYKKQYYQANKDKIKNRIKEYKKNNKDKIKEQQRQYYEKNRNNEIKRVTLYRINNIDKIKEYKKQYYQKNKKYYNQWRIENKDYFKEYRENNKDYFKAAYHKYRTKKVNNGGYYTKEQYNYMLEYFDYKCAYSGKCIKSNLHIDHIIPVSKGGVSYIWNLIPSTPSANLSKNNRDMEEWYKEQEYYSEDRLNKIYEYIEYMKNNFR